MFFGLISDRDLVPDLDEMAGYLVDELQELLAVVSPGSRSETVADPSSRSRGSSGGSAGDTDPARQAATASGMA